MSAAVSTDPELGQVRYCRGCDEWWPLDGEFWYWEPARPKVAHCRACKDSRRSPVKPHWCPTCLAVWTREVECHGCAGRTIGPLTVAVLERAGLAAR